MLKRTVICSMLLCSSVMAARSQEVPRHVQLDPKELRRQFMFTVGAALIDAEREQSLKDPSYVTHDIEMGLVKGMDTEGMIVTVLCEDRIILQILMRVLNRDPGLSTVSRLKFSKILCRGTESIYQVYPAARKE